MKAVSLILMAFPLATSCRASRQQSTATANAAQALTQTAAPTNTPASTPTATIAPTITQTPIPTSSASNTPISTPTTSPGWSSFQEQGIWVAFPETWFLADLESDVYLFIIQSSSPADPFTSTDVSILFYLGPNSAYPDADSLEDIDRVLWDAYLVQTQTLGQKDNVRVESHNAIEVGGEPAIQRIYKGPLLDDPKVIDYKRLVLVVSDEVLYLIDAEADSFSALQRPELEGILASIRFIP